MLASVEKYHPPMRLFVWLVAVGMNCHYSHTQAEFGTETALRTKLARLTKTYKDVKISSLLTVACD
jgi:hypothetical protein